MARKQKTIDERLLEEPTLLPVLVSSLEGRYQAFIQNSRLIAEAEYGEDAVADAEREFIKAYQAGTLDPADYQRVVGKENSEPAGSLGPEDVKQVIDTLKDQQFKLRALKFKALLRRYRITEDIPLEHQGWLLAERLAYDYVRGFRYTDAPGKRAGQPRKWTAEACERLVAAMDKQLATGIYALDAAATLIKTVPEYKNRGMVRSSGRGLKPRAKELVTRYHEAKRWLEPTLAALLQNRTGYKNRNRNS
jgi:hypothetical protein